jgi:hypothetical protein
MNLSATERKLWGLATADDGITAVKSTRAAVLSEAGFATEVTREKIGRLYFYRGESYGVWIGRLGDLLEAGFTSAAEEVCECLACRMGLGVGLCETGKAQDAAGPGLHL